MRKFIILLAVALVALLALPVAANAYERDPVRVTGLYPDGWGSSLGGGVAQVREQYYPSAHRIYCTGVIMVGYYEDSWWRDGGTARYWDKLLCAVKLNKWSNAAVAFVLDAKKSRWVVYRKRNFTW